MEIIDCIIINAIEWGPISEWVLCFLTLSTGIIIYFSFLHESADRKDEQTKTKILIHNYIKSIRPAFKLLTVETTGRTYNTKEINIKQAIYKFQLNENFAKSITIKPKFIDEKYWNDIIFTEHSDFAAGGSRFNILATYSGPYPLRSIPLEGFALDAHFDFFYTDNEGNEYKQNFASTIGPIDNSVSQREPVLIKQVI